MSQVKTAAAKVTGNLAIVLAAVALLAAACGGGGGGSTGSTGGGSTGGGSTGSSTGSSPSSGSNSISLSEFKITPTAVSTAAGSTLAVQNSGTVAHDVVVASSSGTILVKTALIQPGASAQLTLPSSVTAGSYTIYCDVPGHKQQGMTGTLTVS
jgi:nitrite reductase (NO-forming)